jgi:hypothetical protein
MAALDPLSGLYTVYSDILESENHSSPSIEAYDHGTSDNFDQGKSNLTKMGFNQLRFFLRSFPTF